MGILNDEITRDLLGTWKKYSFIQLREKDGKIYAYFRGRHHPHTGVKCFKKSHEYESNKVNYDYETILTDVCSELKCRHCKNSYKPV